MQPMRPWSIWPSMARMPHAIPAMLALLMAPLAAADDGSPPAPTEEPGATDGGNALDLPGLPGEFNCHVGDDQDVDRTWVWADPDLTVHATIKLDTPPNSDGGVQQGIWVDPVCTLDLVIPWPFG